jgi:hypothetical protein
MENLSLRGGGTVGEFDLGSPGPDEEGELMERSIEPGDLRLRVEVMW